MLGTGNRSIALGAVMAMTMSTLGGSATAGPVPHVEGLRFTQDGRVHYGDRVFETREEFIASGLFEQLGLRCATPDSTDLGGDDGIDGGGAQDCTLNFTNPDDVYDPSVVLYRIPVVVHVIRASNGVTGHLSAALVESQIDVMNEDFLAILGSRGEDGTDTQLEFHLATVDPDGNPTNGITYSNNSTWFADSGGYYNTLAWDPHRYMNVYTNNTGALGYVPFLPQSGAVGSNADRIVCYYRAFGRNSGFPPYHLGRTLVHEAGHYFGLHHTFSGGCGSTSCYATGDRICDTGRESGPHFGCPNSTTCGEPDPVHNYLNYTDDFCMEEFTPEQARRMRCTLEFYRPDLFEKVVVCPGDLDDSGEVDLGDLLAILAAWGGAGGPEDLDGSGTVDFADITILLANWGPCP